MEWIKTEDVQDGDIVETPSKLPPHSPIFPNMLFPIVKHYGMILYVQGKQCIVHNIIGRSPTITPCEEVFTDRKIERVLRTGMCGEKILEKYNSCKDKKYDIWNFNCETLMVLIWGSSIGIAQQHAWALGFAIIIILLLILIFSRRKVST